MSVECSSVNRTSESHTCTHSHTYKGSHIYIYAHIYTGSHTYKGSHTHTHGSEDIMEEGGGKNLRSRGRTGPNSVIWT